jgi:hypothetical protein
MRWYSDDLVVREQEVTRGNARKIKVRCRKNINSLAFHQEVLIFGTSLGKV